MKLRRARRRPLAKKPEALAVPGPRPPADPDTGGELVEEEKLVSLESSREAEKPLVVSSSDARPTALRTTLQILLALCVGAAVLWALYRVRSVALLLALSVLFAYMVAPVVAFFRRPVRWLKGRGLPLTAAIWLSYLVIFGIAAAAVFLVWPILTAQLTELRSQAPEIFSKVQSSWRTWKAGQTRMLPRDVRVFIDGMVDGAGTSALDYVKTVLVPKIGGWLMDLPWLILVPIFAVFLIKDAELFRRRALKVFLERRLRWRGDLFFEDVSQSMAAYIRALVGGSIVVATLCSAGFSLLGVSYPILFGVAAGLLEFLPLVGPFIIAVLVVAVTALQSLSGAAIVAGFLLVVRLLEDYVIYPRLVGRELPLHPMAVILAILCGAEIGGVAGVFLAVPTLAVLTVAYRHWRAHRAEESPRPTAV
jgi:predicted PurR-regulated permease PerM